MALLVGPADAVPGRVGVGGDMAPVPAQQHLQDVPSPPLVYVEDGRGRAHHHPQPVQDAGYLPAGLVPEDVLREEHLLEHALVGWVERPGHAVHVVDDRGLGQVGVVDDVDQLADGLVGDTVHPHDRLQARQAGAEPPPGDDPGDLRGNLPAAFSAVPADDRILGGDRPPVEDILNHPEDHLGGIRRGGGVAARAGAQVGQPPLGYRGMVPAGAHRGHLQEGVWRRLHRLPGPSPGAAPDPQVLGGQGRVGGARLPQLRIPLGHLPFQAGYPVQDGLRDAASLQEGDVLCSQLLYLGVLLPVLSLQPFDPGAHLRQHHVIPRDGLGLLPQPLDIFPQRHVLLVPGFEHGKDGFEEGSGVGYGVPVNLFQVDCRRHARTWEGMIHKSLEHAASAGKRGAKASRRESLDPKITLSVDRADNVQLNRAFTAENVAQMIINRGRSGMESLRKGDLLPKKT